FRSVACIERNRLGGVCLNWGCIPSKALLHNAELYMEAVRHGKEWGIEFEKAPTVNWDTIIKRSRGATDQLNKGVAYLLKKNKIDHYEGHGRIVSGKTAGKPCTVEVRAAEEDYHHGSATGGVKNTLTADKVMIATGAAPRALPGAPFDGKTVLSSYHAMVLPKQPKSMLVVGSGAIGMEFAYFYNAFGTEVTVVEMVDRILPIEDDEISKLAERNFAKQGIKFHTSHTVKKVDVQSRGGAHVTIVDVNDEKKTQELKVDVVLVAIGVSARFEGLFEKSLGIEV